MVSDAAAMEAAMWADIADRLAIGVARTSAVEVAEQLARCDLVAQRAAFVINLATSLATRNLEAAALAARDASALASEVSAWQQVLDAAAAEAVRIVENTFATATASADSGRHVGNNERAPVAEHQTQQPVPVNSNGDQSVAATAAATAAAAAAKAAESAARQAQERQAAAEARVLELQTRELTARAQVDTHRDEVGRLERDASELREAVSRLRREEADVAAALQARQAASLSTRRDLEGQLEGLRVDLGAAKDHLGSLRLDIVQAEDDRRHAQAAADEARRTAAGGMGARSSAPAAPAQRHLSDSSFGSAAGSAGGVGSDETHAPRAATRDLHGDFTSAAAPLRHHSPPRQLDERVGSVRFEATSDRHAPVGGSNTANGLTSADARSPPRRRQGNEQTIESGLAALQSVREQLRDLRGQAGSPPRGEGGAGSPLLGNAAGSFSSASFDGLSPTLQRANTGPAGRDTSGASLIASSRLRTSASMILDANHAAGPSPWKQRLLKLQGDLRTLRSELGSSGPSSPRSDR
jgi:TolA-binding protein